PGGGAAPAARGAGGGGWVGDLRNGRGPAGPRPASGPELAVEVFDGRLRRRGRVAARGQVLPAPVRDDEDDVRRFTGPEGPAGDADGRVEGRAGRDAGEDALLGEEFTRSRHRVGRADGEARGQHRLVVELGDEALVQVPQPVDQVVVARLGRDDLDVG